MTTMAARDTAVLRLGCVPEHFSTPIFTAVSNRYIPHDIELQPVLVPAGSGAMLQSVARGELDAAVVLTESAEYAIQQHNAPIRVVSTYVESPLRWALLAPSKGSAVSAAADVANKPGVKVGISRLGSGSHLVAAELAKSNTIEFVVCNNYTGLLAASDKGEIDCFLWEVAMTRKDVDAGRLTLVDVVTPPHPAFVVVVASSYEKEHPTVVERAMKGVGRAARELTPEQVVQQWHIPEKDVLDWWSHVRFSAVNVQ